MGIIRSNAELEGDSKPMGNAGTGTGLNGDTYGADISGDATNPLGNITGATKSDHDMEGIPCHVGVC